VARVLMRAARGGGLRQDTGYISQNARHSVESSFFPHKPTIMHATIGHIWWVLEWLHDFECLVSEIG